MAAGRDAFSFGDQTGLELGPYPGWIDEQSARLGHARETPTQAEQRSPFLGRQRHSFKKFVWIGEECLKPSLISEYLVDNCSQMWEHGVLSFPILTIPAPRQVHETV